MVEELPAVSIDSKVRKESKEEGKAQYGYNDATGDYYITIDLNRCDGCGKCVLACPAAVFEVVQENGRQPKARVVEAVRKRLSIVCPGYRICNNDRKDNCQSVCQQNAITHSW